LWSEVNKKIMQHRQLTFAGRVRAGFVAGAAGLLLLGTTLAGTALADQAPAAQTTSSSQAPQAIGPHTHQIHGIVKTAPSAGSTTFVVTTERYGDVNVSFAGATAKGHGHAQAHGKPRASELTSAANLKVGDRVIVQGATSADGKSFIARRVHLLPSRDTTAHPTHLVGTIASVATSGGTTTLSVKLADGTTQSVTVSSETRIRPNGKTLADLTVGTKVTLISKNGSATGVVVMPA
jgi:hypothetical protein